jgi:ABC-type cobalamin/Fe3+-siderophores transport system ATPase subunit
MRLDRVYIDGFKNLKQADVDFDESRLTTVIIGQNGSGKSNLIEAIVDVFRFVDTNEAPPRFRYEIDYRLDGKKIRLTNRGGAVTILCNEEKVSRTEFDRNKHLYFPDLVFGYYSGGSRRLERLFDSHQRDYYKEIKTNENADECAKALTARRLFYCRPIHGIFALLAFLAKPKDSVSKLLKDKLGVTGYHSTLAVFHQPWFFTGGKREATAAAHSLWKAGGPAGKCARAIQSKAFHPVVLRGNAIEDYRDKGGDEAQLGSFFPDLETLNAFAKNYLTDAEMFYALEAMDISDLIRDFHLWVKRTNDDSGDIGFTDLSDGERQLLMALGLIRIARGKRTLFLLDEPDTHLNPHWQHSYLDLIREWTEVASEESKCHIILTSHNPLTISALQKEEVRVMVTGSDGKTAVSAPYTDPRGLGFTATLTEIFGLPTTLDQETQRAVDDRNTLAQIAERSEVQERSLIEINDKLNRLGFMFEDREPLYKDFLQSWRDVRYADRPPLTAFQVEARRKAMSALIKELIAKKESAS